jgi:hypothetical protein
MVSLPDLGFIMYSVLCFMLFYFSMSWCIFCVTVFFLCVTVFVCFIVLFIVIYSSVFFLLCMCTCLYILYFNTATGCKPIRS